MEQFTASEVRDYLFSIEERSSRQWLIAHDAELGMLRQFADLLEAREKAVPVYQHRSKNGPILRWFDCSEETFMAMEHNEHDSKHFDRRILYTHPTPADADRLADQRDDAFQQAVQEARRVWMDEFPCEAGHDHVTPFDQFLYGNRPCMEAQPPAVSVTDEMIERARSAFVRAEDGSTGITDAIRAALLAAAPQPQAQAQTAEPVGEVVGVTGSVGEMRVIRWRGRYSPEVGTKLYTRPQPAQDAALYQELLMAVSKKVPNESRHETALRYIKQIELQSCEPKCDAAMPHESGR